MSVSTNLHQTVLLACNGLVERHRLTPLARECHQCDHARSTGLRSIAMSFTFRQVVCDTLGSQGIVE